MKTDWKRSFIGVRVTQSSYGEGIIVGFDGSKVQVEFANGKRAGFLLGFNGPNALKVDEREPTGIKTQFSKWRIILGKDRNKGKLYSFFCDMKHNKYHFEGFVHYTSIRNLESVLDSGYLFSRYSMLRRRRRWEDIASEDVLKNTNDEIFEYVRMFYGFNTPISYSFEKTMKQQGATTVALVFSVELLLFYEVLFFERSAAGFSNRYGYKTAFEDVERFSWDEIFQRGAMYDNKEIMKKYRDAEILIPDKVSLKFLETVYFRDAHDYNSAIDYWGYNDIFKIGRVGDNEHFSGNI